MTTKILVIDDKCINIEAAKICFSSYEYDLTVSSSYDEAEKYINNEEWDVVLTDLFMPASKNKQNPNSDGFEFVGKEFPVGFSLMIQASLRGAKYVGLYTYTNHHDHPGSALLDNFLKTHFFINESKVFVISGFFQGVEVDKITCPSCNGEGCDRCQNGEEIIYGKDWMYLFKRIKDG